MIRDQGLGIRDQGSKNKASDPVGAIHESLDSVIANQSADWCGNPSPPSCHSERSEESSAADSSAQAPQNDRIRRVTLFCGHYGSGKSNLAVNYAIRLQEQGLRTALADIDVVNPYFRSADSRKELEAAGVQVITLPFANSNVDLPALPQEVYGLVQRRDVHAVLDVGGDDRGALALGRYVPYILEENDYENLFVVNFYRPLTQTAADALEVLREIEQACRLPFTGIVNNSNLGRESRAADIERTFSLAEELSVQTGLPIVFTSYEKSIPLDCENGFPLTLQHNNPAFS